MEPKIERTKSFSERFFRKKSTSSKVKNSKSEADFSKLVIVEEAKEEVDDDPTPAEQRILDSFGTANSILWENFSNTLKTVLRTKPETIDRLKYTLAPYGLVYKEEWANFASWFTPIVATVRKTKNDQEGVFTLEEIADIVGQDWFFGWMSAAEAKDYLEGLPKGTFLIRFSSSPKQYTLSLNYGFVAHWRINSEKPVGGPVSFVMDKAKYTSLQELIEMHSVGMNSIPLVIKGETCQLVEAAKRSKK